MNRRGRVCEAFDLVGVQLGRLFARCRRHGHRSLREMRLEALLPRGEQVEYLRAQVLVRYRYPHARVRVLLSERLASKCVLLVMREGVHSHICRPVLDPPEVADLEALLSPDPRYWGVGNVRIARVCEELFEMRLLRMRSSGATPCFFAIARPASSRQSHAWLTRSVNVSPTT